MERFLEALSLMKPKQEISWFEILFKSLFEDLKLLLYFFE